MAEMLNAEQIPEVQKRVNLVNLVNLVKGFQTSSYYLLAKFGFDTAENESLKVCLIFKLWDLIST